MLVFAGVMDMELSVFVRAVSDNFEDPQPLTNIKAIDRTADINLKRCRNASMLASRKY